MAKRIFLFVLDSLGIGAAPDAALFGDEGSDTLRSITLSEKFFAPTLERLGLFHINGVFYNNNKINPSGAYARLTPRSAGKDTTIGHWEIAGIVSERPMPTYPSGFPNEIIDRLKEETGRGVLCNLPYSGTQAIHDFGEEHLHSGDLIVYTSADSVFQIAAHEEKVPIEQLYEICRIARRILTGEHAVGRVIARPFVGNGPEDFTRTSNRHDFSVPPPRKTMLDELYDCGFSTIGIGKIYDIFAGEGVSEQILSKGNRNGMELAMQTAKRDFEGLCFVNLVDFDSQYGHRRDIDGYATAVSEFDQMLDKFMTLMRHDDLLIITADHGCDPGFTATTDHTREYVPMLCFGSSVTAGLNLGTRDCFGDIAATVLDYFDISAASIDGESFLKEIMKQ